ncbi:MAG: deoxyribodipyrimidine photo-lyase, partial [Microbacteriaceae bacterium]|nr:deoxyribodipyrimidine photo-lyase [Microbacteriaceae bacterium]
MATLVWFRDDLRLADHPALAAAAADPDGVIAVYMLDDESPEVRPPGGAARWWLHESLTRLRESLEALGVPLILRRGSAETVIPELVTETSAIRFVWNRRYGAERHLDARIKASLLERGIAADSFIGNVLFEPWTIATQTGGSYRVYSAFWRACLAAPSPAQPIAALTALTPAHNRPSSDDLADWHLQPNAPNWAGGLAERWQPGERVAHDRLREFLAGPVREYATQRDVPSADAGSEISPHLRWGEISARTVWHESVRSGEPVGEFLSELGWREFAWHTLYAHSDLHLRGLNARFDRFPWRSGEDHPEHFTAWQRGETGYGLVDAGMRELWQTGFMHNRVRMVTASFLTKNLLIDWREGEAWFWDTLVDADPASNPFNWQWVAGCGADAAPYFRVFNPETQQQKFDPDGT